MNSYATDIFIVGAGPAGTAAAITLARAGRQVTIIDKATFPRDKCCGDGLTAGALRILERLGVGPPDVPSWVTVDAAWVRSPSGHEVRFPMPPDGIFAAVAPRRQLDDALLRRAAAAGAVIHQGHAFESISMTDDGAALAISGLGDVAARYVIAADGMWSPVRRAIGAGEPGYLGEWHAFRQYFSNVTGPAAERLYVWFEADILPGYAWSFPLPDGRANVGFGIARGHGISAQSMNTRWPELLARPHIAAALGPDAVGEGRHLAWPIPARVDSATLSKGRVLLVGDAACLTDPMTGEGIGQALLSGVLAAEAIIAMGTDSASSAEPAGPSGASGASGASGVRASGVRASGTAAEAAAVRRHYESAIRRHLLADHRMSAALSALLRHQLLARGAIKVAGSTDWTRRNFGRWLFEDEPRAIAVTPRRWHRHFLSRSGAYAE
jgi:menaquinone-9 beta-reductase